MWPTLIPLISGLLDKFLPDPKAAADAKLRMIELAQAGELAQLDADLKLALGQTEINRVEAASTNWWVAGWRPGCGWVCVSGLAVQFLIAPLCTWIATLAGHPLAFPPLDTGTLLTLLLGLLGLGGMRTVEKVKGAEGNR